MANQVIECTAVSCRFNALERCALPEIVVRPDLRGNVTDVTEAVQDASQTFCASFDPR